MNDQFFLLFGMPLAISAVMAVAMLFSRRTFVALVISCAVAAAWLLAAFVLLGALIGALMLMAAPWFFLIVLVLNFSSAAKENYESLKLLADEPSSEGDRLGCGPQRCATCNFQMPQSVRSCPICRLRATRFKGVTF